MSEIVRWSAVETVQNLRAKEVSAVEVCEAHLARLEAVRDLNAVVEDVPEALDWAREIDAGTRPGGLLAGAPITTKINADMAGYANSNGIAGLAGNMCAEDSAVVANLKGSGGVIIGRTNTPEMSMRWCTSNPLYGVTLNPWGQDLTPGGSSGGASASVSSGVGVIAHGNDLGGSVRYPAYACGIVGLKPSRGCIPAYNPSAAVDRPEMTMAFSVQGPLGRSVADVQLGLDAMRGYHLGDANWSAARVNGRQRAAGPLRVGVVDQPFATPMHADVAEACKRAAGAAEACGMELRPVTLPEAERCFEVWGHLLFTETQSMYEDLIRSETSEDLQRWIETFMDVFKPLDLDAYIRTMADRQRLQRLWAELWEEVDLLILPVSLLPPFQNDLDFKEPARGPDLVAAQKPLCVLNLLGLPGLSLPTHVQDGVPLGVQLVGPMHDEDAVLAAGALLEEELGSVLGQMPERYRI